ncbi:MAG: transposase, partial [Candidatus Levyibacteriota bacterium]
MIDFQEMFPNDQACFAYLCLVKWPEGFVCASCGAKEYWKIKPYGVMCKSCRKKQSVTAGTIFQDLHLPLYIIFQAMWYVVCQKNGVSALGLKSILGLGSYETAWAWMHKLRTA